MAGVFLIDIGEFRRSGMLQEVNEQYFWPRGLALTVITDSKTGEVSLYGIQKLPTEEEANGNQATDATPEGGRSELLPAGTEQADVTTPTTQET